MFKKILLIITIPILSLTLIACQKTTLDQPQVNFSVSDTGRVIDVTNLNYQVIFAVPGDALLISLKANQDSGYQWSFREPVTGGYLSLKRHDVIAENDARLKPGELISEWKFKVEKASQFNLRLDYEKPLTSKQPKEVFLVKIISDKKEAEVLNILVDAPPDGSEALAPLWLKGFARVSEGTVNYQLKDESGKVLAEGFTAAKAGAPEFGYFEKEIKFKKPKTGNVALEIFQKNAEDGSEINRVVRTLK